MKSVNIRPSSRRSRGSTRPTRPRPAIERFEERLLMATSFLQGYVTNPSSLPIPGATVILQPLPSGSPLTATTNSDGYYRFDTVAAGNYRLTEVAPAAVTSSVAIDSTINSGVAAPGNTAIDVTVYDPATYPNIGITKNADPYAFQSVKFVLNASATNAAGPFNTTPPPGTAGGDTVHQYDLTLSGNNGDVHRILTLCTDLFHFSGTGYTLTPSLTPNSTTLTTNLGAIGYLYNHYGRALQTGGSGVSVNGAGLALALWELEYDSSPDLFSGNFQVLAGGAPAAVVAAANSYISQASGKDERAFFLNGSLPAGTVADQGMISTDLFNFTAAPATPGIQLVKLTNGTNNDAGPGPFVAVGSAVTWTYDVTNTGNVALSNVTVTDDNGTPGNTADDFAVGTIASLAPGAKAELTYAGIATAGQYGNVGTATGTPVDDHGNPIPDVTNPTSTNPDHYFGYTADIHILKLTNGTDNDSAPGVHVAAGSAVAWTYEVTTTGNVPLSGVAVTDNIPGVTPVYQSGDGNGDGLLEAGETWIYTAGGTATAGQYTNVGAVTGTPSDTAGTPIPGSTPQTDHNPDNYFGDAPGIKVVKYVNGDDADSAPGVYVPAGSALAFTYVVTNTGNVPLAAVALTDDKLGAIASFTGDTNGDGLLDTGETWTFTQSAVAQAGQVTNVGTVTGEDAYVPTSTVTDNNPANYTGYNLVTIGDFVWNDTNANGVQDSGEPGIPGVTLTITGTDITGASVSQTTTTDGTGHYLFTEVPGTYTVAVSPPAGYVATATGAGTTATDSNPSPSGTTPATLASGGSDLSIDFGFYQNVTIGDFVWNDSNGNGVQDSGETGIPGVTLTLTGTTGAGASITQTTTTDGTGHYLFTEPPGTYTVAVTPPAGYVATATGAGTTATDSNTSPSGTTPGALPGGSSDLTIDFGFYMMAGPSIATTPISTTTPGGVVAGQFATIGFWHNQNGQAVINSFNGGSTATQLGTWLATSFPNLFGAPNSYTSASLTSFGTSSFAGLTNAQVATAYLNLWTPSGLQKNAYVQAFAVALGLYADTTGLGGQSLLDNGLASQFGFVVTAAGAGSFGVDANGSAFGVTNGTSLSVVSILQIADANFSPTATLFYGGDQAKTSGADNVLNGINSVGDIPGSSGGLTSGGVVHLNDTATLSGGNNPTGTITFYLMAPGSTASTPLSSAVYTDIVTVSGNTTYSTATSGNHPGGYVPTTTGTYQWVAVYSGDAMNNGVTSPFGSEPWIVGAASPTINTIPGGAVLLTSGEKLTDTATLAAGANPTGTISFYLFAPGITPNATYSNNVYADTVTVNGNTTYSTATGTNPGGYVPTVAGTYQWVAVYSGDANNNGVAGAFGDEPEVVNPGGSLAGTKFADATGNGFSADDTPLGGVTILLYKDANNDGSLTTADGAPVASKVTATTGSVGGYNFDNLAPGTYFVAESVAPASLMTAPYFNTQIFNGSSYYKAVVDANGNASFSSGNGNFDDFQTDDCAATNISYTINGSTTVTNLRGNTHQGDTVTVKFTLPAHTTDEVSLVSYTAPGATFDANTAYLQQIYQDATGVFTNSTSSPQTYTLTVRIPNCYYQIDFVCGEAIDQFGPAGSNIFYSAQGRLFSADNGGTQACGSNLGIVTGTVFCDTNLDGVQNSGENGEAGAVVRLTNSAHTLSITETADADGNYLFNNLPAGTYTVSLLTPSDGHAAELSHGAVTLSTSKTIALAANGTSTNSFAEVEQGSLSGVVFSDDDDNGVQDSGEAGIPNVTVTLTGTDYLGNAVSRTTTTDVNGNYSISGLLPSDAAGYTLRETQPAGYLDGSDSPGTINGVTVGADSGADSICSIVLAGCNNSGVNYNFGELGILHGLTATIGFWHNKNGQALIKSFGTCSSGLTLANWLATTYPNLFGKNAPAWNVNSKIGTNLTGRSNTDVANYFLSLFGVSGTKSYAQVLATALAVFTTTNSLDTGSTSRSLADKYGFSLSNTGAGAATYTVPSADWAAFGITSSSGATKSISQLLVLANKYTSSGKLNGGTSTLITKTNDVFNAINNKGDIGSGMAILANGATTAGTLFTGSLGEVYAGTYLVQINVPQGDVGAAEKARIEDALDEFNATLGTFGVVLAEIPAGVDATPDIQIDLADTTPIGGVSDGVLGVTLIGGHVMIVDGWNWYTGSDPSIIGADQFDFQTVVAHELGHSLGLAHSADTASVMYPMLDTGEVRRILSASDLAELDGEANDNPEPLMAAPSATTVATAPAATLATLDAALDQIAGPASEFTSSSVVPIGRTVTVTRGTNGAGDALPNRLHSKFRGRGNVASTIARHSDAPANGGHAQKAAATGLLNSPHSRGTHRS